MQYGLDKSHRLKARTAIQRLMRRGQRHRSGCIQFILLKPSDDTDGVALAGFSAPKRRLRWAVDRNRIKRMMRKAYLEEMRDIQDHLPLTGCYHLFFIYQGRLDTPPAEIRRHMRNCLTLWINS